MLEAVVAVLGGVLPTLVYVALVWWLDRYEKEPVRLLVTAFLWGALPAALLAVVLELILDLPVAALGGESLVANLITSSVTAPLVEESCKGLALLALVLLVRREFDDELDGFVYGAMIGFGFALTENVFAYFVPIASEQGLQAGVTNLLWRSIVFGVNHAFWCGITGAALGTARLAGDRRVRILAPVGGYALAVTFHATHNLGATLAAEWSSVCLGVNILVDWGGILLLLFLVVRVLRRESRWIERGLVEEVRRGDLSQEEFLLLRSAGKRLSRRWAARRMGGPAAYRTVGRYFQCATELAFAKQHLRSLGDEQGNLARIQALRQEMATLREQAGPWL